MERTWACMDGNEAHLSRPVVPSPDVRPQIESDAGDLS